MQSPYLGTESASLLQPICSDNMSDSQNFDSVLELLVHGSERTLAESAMMMAPEAWEKNMQMRTEEPERTALIQYNSMVMEPWDGPAMLAFTGNT